MRQHDHFRSRAFTLIELLVVVTVVLILAGISMKVMSAAGNKAAVAKTNLVLEQVKNALAGYYLAYGAYPPVSNVKSVAPYKQPASLLNDPSLTRGLTAYLLTGKEGTALTKAYFNPEAAKWEHYLDGIYSKSTGTNGVQQGMSMIDVTNMNYTINDGWGNEIKYSSPGPDYQSYTLWSGGGDSGSADDIYVTFQ